MEHPTLTIRAASPQDDEVLRRLAALDSAHPLTGRVLLAELEGVPVAAVSVDAGSVTSDPFQHSADAVRMLMFRRRQILRQSGGSAPTGALAQLTPNPAS